MLELSRRAFLAGTGLAVVAKGSLVLPSPAWASPKVGAPAPAFTANATTGKAVSLADQRGKIVVLEWTNHDCPYVVKHYSTSNMQALQKEATGQGVVWLTIISSAPGTQGHVSAAQADELTASRKASPTAVLLDPTGSVGKAYGAIDDKPTTRKADVQGAQNYVREALAAVAAGQPVKTPVTRAYGCTVKYA